MQKSLESNATNTLIIFSYTSAVPMGFPPWLLCVQTDYYPIHTKRKVVIWVVIDLSSVDNFRVVRVVPVTGPNFVLRVVEKAPSLWPWWQPWQPKSGQCWQLFDNLTFCVYNLCMLIHIYYRVNPVNYIWSPFIESIGKIGISAITPSELDLFLAVFKQLPKYFWKQIWFTRVFGYRHISTPLVIT